MPPITIYVNNNLLVRVDEFVKKTGYGATRSAFFNYATEYYLDVKLGIKNRSRKNELEQV